MGADPDRDRGRAPVALVPGQPEPGPVGVPLGAGVVHRTDVRPRAPRAVVALGGVDVEVVGGAAVAGGGITGVAAFVAGPCRASGQLCRLFEKGQSADDHARVEPLDYYRCVRDRYELTLKVRTCVDYLQALRDDKDRIFHIDAKDVIVDDQAFAYYGIFGKKLNRAHEEDLGFWTPVIPGLGDINWSQFYNVMKEIGFDSWFSIEHEDRRFAVNNTEVKKGLEYAYNHLNPIIHEFK